jgi:sugar phosphate isomerase/epimerase
MHFALSTHLFHHERLGPPQLDAIAAHGFRVVEIFATRSHFDYHDPSAIDAMAGWLSERTLRVETMHAPIFDRYTPDGWGRPFSNASTREDVRREAIRETTLAIEAARRLECRAIVVHLGVPDSQPVPAGDNDAAAVGRSLDEIGTVAASAKIAIALEVMGNRLSTPDAIAARLEGGEAPESGTCLDVGHAHLLGGAPEAIERLAGHVVTTHIHDNRGRSDDHLLPFEGTIDWGATIMAFGKVGYTGGLVFELANRGDATGILRRAVRVRERLQAILDDLAAPFEFGA